MYMDILESEIEKTDPYHLSPKLDEIKGDRKRGKIKELRDMFVIEVLEYKSLSQVELGKKLDLDVITICKIWCNKLQV